MDSQPCHTLLLVDDVPAVREALRWALEAAPDLVVVGEAGDGVAALLLASDLHPDVVILDIELPRLDGYTACVLLKAMPHPPAVIFLTIHTDAASRQRSQEAGGDGFVEKGLDWAALIPHVRAVLATT